MLPHHSSPQPRQFVNFLRLRLPRTLCVIAVLAAVAICFSPRARQLAQEPSSQLAEQALDQKVVVTVPEGQGLRRSRPVRGQADKSEALRDPQFQPAVSAPPLSTGRDQHTATQLLSGKLLVVGGRNTGGALATAQLYDPSAGSWANTGGLRTARYGHVAVLLQTGKVLVAGGRDTAGNYLASAELYDPATGVWSATGNLLTARSRSTATLLPPTSTTSPNGKVLLAAGEGAGGASLATVELYDPISGTWSAAGSLANARREHTATLLGNGRVLVVGGLTGNTAVRVAEVYSPILNSWSAAGLLRTPRSRHTATALVDGRVLVVGGESGGSPLSSSELYNPSTNAWALTTSSLNQPHRSHSATLLTNGKVLIAGGFGSAALAEYQLFDPATQAWGGTGNLLNARVNHTATLLANGAVMFVGGGLENNSTYLASTELFEFAAPLWTGAGLFSSGRELHTTTLLGNGKVLLVGGLAPNQTLVDAQLYDPATNSWSKTGSLNFSRDTHDATLLPSGKVLVSGGLRFISATQLAILGSSETYDPNTAGWLPAGSMTTLRAFHTMTLLADGRVLVTGGAGGATGNQILRSAEIFNPATGQWTQTGSMNDARYSHAATLLPGGKVLVSGGFDGFSSLSTAELYDPSTGIWSRTGSLGIPRDTHAALLLPNGKVLVTGGISGNSVVNSAELYDPASGFWMQVNGMGTPRLYHTATLLTSGKVLVTGGVSDDPTFDSSYLATAELFDPSTNSWSQTSPLSHTRALHRAVLLLSGQVMVCGGIFGISDGLGLRDAELYDPGLGFSNESRPVIGKVTLSNGVFSLTGVRFQSASEGSSGNSQNSVGNFPVVQLRDVESGQVRVLTPGTSGWSNNGFTAQSIGASPSGYSLLTVISDGVPSPAQPFSSAATGPVLQPITISGRVSTLSNTGFRATMTLTSSTGERRVTQTNANGEYSFSALPIVPQPSPTVFCQGFTFSPAILPSGTVNAGYSQGLTLSGGSAPYTLALASGSLPRGLTLNLSNGVISGTPSLAGTFTFTIRATDQRGCTDTQNYALTINTATCPAITISPATLSDGTYGFSYSQTLTASPSGTYTFAVTQGSLPPGLSLNQQSGVISGVPSIYGSFSFTIRATNPNACTGSRAYSIFISYGETFVKSPGARKGREQTAPLAPDQQGVTYTVTPSGTTPGGQPVSFSPPSQSFSGSGGNVNNANFQVVGPPVDVTGAIKDLSNLPLGQVKVTITYKDPVTEIYQFYDDYTTDGTGSFTFATLPPGNAYRITPQRTGYNFSFPDFSDAPVLDFPNLVSSYPGVQCLWQQAALAPTVTTNSATIVTTTSATLNGTVNPNGAATQTSFEYATNISFVGSTITNAQSLPAGNSAQPVSLNLTNLTPGTTYYFRVLASNSAGPATGLGALFTTLSCSYSLGSASQNFAAGGGSNSVGVTTSAGCAWTAVSNAGWITINSGTPGNGNGTVSYTVAANTGPQRTGTMTIAGKTFTVTQDTGCTFNLTSSSQNYFSGGGSNSVGVTTVAGCAWTAVSNDGWITVNSGTPGNGNGTVGYTVAANTGPQRTGTMTIAGKTFTVTQDNGCTFNLASSSQNFASGGGSNSVGVTTTAGCAWTAVSNDGWITIISGTPGNGNGTVGYTVAANTGPQRTGTMTIAGKTFTVTQDNGCTFNLASSSQNFASGGGSNSVGVTTTAGCAWTAVSNDGWITINSGTPGNGNGTVSYTVAANTGPQRTGTMTIAGKTFTVTQDNGCTFNLASSSQTFASGGGSNSVGVTTTAGCAWTAVSNDGWITVNSGTPGNGNGTVGYTVAANAGSQRTGTMTIAGKTFTVQQSGQPVSSSGLMFYPLVHPIRLLDTRPANERPGPAYDTPGTKLQGLVTGGTPRAQQARVAFDGVTIPLNASAIVGTATVINFPDQGQYNSSGNITFYPNGTVKPEVSNLNYDLNQTISNSFTVGLGDTGAFDIFAYSNVHLVIDVVGYYAPPDNAGLYYHPLSKPIRLLETRSNPIYTGCDTPRVALAGGSVRTEQGRVSCGGVTIPAAAQALVGNLTTVNSVANGLATAYASDQISTPISTTLAYVSTQAIPNAFITRLGGDGSFKLYVSQTTDALVDIVGYFSSEATDINGQGLFFNQLAHPVRLLETRPELYYPGCDTPRAPLAGNSERIEQARINCDGVTIPATAQAVVGNATVVNFISAGSGNVTLYPTTANRPEVSNLNYVANQVIPNAFTVGLSNDGRFTIYVFSSIHLLIDISGYYAP